MFHKVKLINNQRYFKFNFKHMLTALFRPECTKIDQNALRWGASKNTSNSLQWQIKYFGTGNRKRLDFDTYMDTAKTDNGKAA